MIITLATRGHHRCSPFARDAGSQSIANEGCRIWHMRLYRQYHEELTEFDIWTARGTGRPRVLGTLELEVIAEVRPAAQVLP
jgi:hypothetical protein